MYPLYFSALLKNADGGLIEEGEACIAEQENSILFNSEFVPLMKLGTPAQIVRIAEGQEEELASFSGKVYLSSRKLLQLTDIDPHLMQLARTIFSVNENIPVQLMLPPGASLVFSAQKVSWVAGHLRYISEDEVKLIAMEMIPTEKVLAFSLQTPQLVLNELRVQVFERIPLKKNTAILRCRLFSPSVENKKAIRTYLDRSRESIYL